MTSILVASKNKAYSSLEFDSADKCSCYHVSEIGALYRILNLILFRQIVIDLDLFRSFSHEDFLDLQTRLSSQNAKIIYIAAPAATAALASAKLADTEKVLHAQVERSHLQETLIQNR